MKYFLHSTTSFSDEKITKLFINYGYEGLGLFYTLLERLGLQEEPIKEEVLQKQLFVGKRLIRCWEYMKELGLITISNGDVFNENIMKNSEKYKVSKEKSRDRIKRWRERQSEKIENTPQKTSRKKPKILFKESIWFDKKKFFEDCPKEWWDLKKEYYYNAALNYSEQGGNLYSNWISAVKNWDNKKPYLIGQKQMNY